MDDCKGVWRPYATDSLYTRYSGIGTESDFLEVTEWDPFNITSGTIVGIKVDCICSASAFPSSNKIVDAVVQLYRTSDDTYWQPTTSPSPLDWPSSLSTRTWGGSTDNWGSNGWQLSDFNNNGVRFQLAIKGSSPGSGMMYFATIDYISITVYTN